MSKLLKEDSFPGTVPGTDGGERSFDGGIIEQNTEGYFDGAELLTFFREILANHEGQFQAHGTGNIRVFFWDMTEEDPEVSHDAGFMLCFQVENSIYAIPPVRRREE
jgi:hypothetical protein